MCEVVFLLREIHHMPHLNKITTTRHLGWDSTGTGWERFITCLTSTKSQPPHIWALIAVGLVAVGDISDFFALMVMGVFFTSAQVSGDPLMRNMVSPNTRSASVNSWMAWKVQKRSYLSLCWYHKYPCQFTWKFEKKCIKGARWSSMEASLKLKMIKPIYG